MTPTNLVMPALALGGAALLFLPLAPSRAFTKNPGSLDLTQRDVRVYNNFADATANDNTTPDAQFPGRTGAELAIWKGVVEWGSTLHGDGTGDGLAGNPLGSGGANFDGMWAGSATGVGTTDSNIISAISSCGGGGSVCFTELPITDGWRIRFCDTWTFDDGPFAVGSRYDIQGLACAMYGLALGLGHSSVAGATMIPTVNAGETYFRSLSADDIAGVQCKYGVASATKPIVTATVASAGTLTIHGSQFAAANNEVWFTNAVATGGTNPIVKVTGVDSTSGATRVTVAIPAGAGPGDVMVKRPGSGGAALSNAFPTDLVGTFGSAPSFPYITSVSPATLEALIPGTAETVTLSGHNLDLSTAVLLDGVPISPSRYTIVNATTITLDMPQAASLGGHALEVTDGSTTDAFSVTVAAPALPRLEWGTGDPLNVVDRDNGLDMIVSGPVGGLQVVRASPNGPPSFARYLRSPDLSLVDAGAYVIPAEGWLAVHLGALPDPALVGSTWFARSFALDKPKPFPASNDQSITLVP